MPTKALRCLSLVPLGVAQARRPRRPRRVMPLALPDETAGWSTAVAVIAAATMTLGKPRRAAAAKRRAAARLNVHRAVRLPAHGRGRPGTLRPGAARARLLRAGVRAMNLGAFAAVLAVQRERRLVDLLDAFHGLGRTHPWWTVVLVVSFLSLPSLPPLAGFVGGSTRPLDRRPVAHPRPVHRRHCDRRVRRDGRAAAAACRSRHDAARLSVGLAEAHNRVMSYAM